MSRDGPTPLNVGSAAISGDDAAWESRIPILSRRPFFAAKGVITISQPPRLSTITRKPVSSLGRLDNIFPPEILHAILASLNFQALSRFSRASFGTKALIESLREYQAMMEHAPEALAALGRTGTIKLHSAATIYSVLRTEKCDGCARYGAFLFLPTCRRCCWQCLRDDQSLWTITTSEATGLLGLSAHQLSQLPIIRSIPGSYLVRADVTHWQATDEVYVQQHILHEGIRYLVSFESALQLAAALQTTPERFWPILLGSRHSGKDYSVMAAVGFPSVLPGRGVEHGLWCRGCDWALEHRQGMSRAGVSLPLAEDYVRMRLLLGHARRAWSKADFLEHIQHRCSGMRSLIPYIDTLCNKTEFSVSSTHYRVVKFDKSLQVLE